jgi:hypothetical protein
MAYVLCTINDGLRPTEVTVSVRDNEDRPQFLRVHRDFVKNINNAWYLPIGIVYHDRDKDVFLIELPHEADSGANRLWVNAAAILEPRIRRETVLT